ncbi:MAG: hypothetical protein IKP28_03600 [Clostridia bacterium]|nr:hypothetical protein [Clostridia bacterium]
MQKIFNNKGVTLIALIVTVIILLILAGIAIGAGFNSGNMIDTTSNTVDQMNNRIADYQSQTNSLWEQAVLNNPNDSAPTPPTLIEKVTGNSVLAVASGGTAEGSAVAGYQYSLDGSHWSSTIPEGEGWLMKINEIAQMDPSSLWNYSNATKTTPETSIIKSWQTEAKTRVAPIPIGYQASIYEGENTIAGGLVIYEGSNALAADGQSTAMTTRNQFVWIPVDDLNCMIMCTSAKQNTATLVYARTISTSGRVSISYSQEVTEISACNIVMGTDGDLICTTHNSKDLCSRIYRRKRYQHWNLITV